MRNIQVLRLQRSIQSDTSETETGLLRILVVDEDSEIVGQLENALWVWPHRITLATNVEDSVRLCKHLTPSAILVAVDGYKSNETRAIPALRRRIPDVPIIAIVSPRQYAEPGRFLDQGADALLLREDAHRPTLHDLLMSVQHSHETAVPAARAHAPELALPWSQSEMMGALICDISGSIADANQLLATWLGYPNPDELRGRNVSRNVLTDADNWGYWVQVAADRNAILHQQAGILTRHGQVMWMELEVTAAPKHPSYLQAVFADRTALTVPSDAQGMPQ